MPTLRMQAGPLAGREIEVESELVLGRTNADLTIEDPLISRRHAIVRPVDGTVEIEDAGSLNGTWVNGERITEPRRLQTGDIVAVGDTTIEVEADAGIGGRTVLAQGVPGLDLDRSAAPAPDPLPEPAPAPPLAEPERLEPLPAFQPDHAPVAVEQASEEPAPAPPQVAAPVAPAPSPAPSPLQRRHRAPSAASAGLNDELRPVTALFADIVGSTALGERLSPDEVKVVVGECVTRMCHAVEQYGGRVQAYMGDGIAVFFGVPSAHEDDPERAARAALRIIDVVHDYAREVEAAWGISNFNARVGINTGETAVGMVGGENPQSVSLGDTSNVAARLQSAADPGTVVVGEATAKSIVHRFVLEPKGEISVKGRTKPVGHWRLVSVQAATESYDRTPLVGREAEMARLYSILEELTAGRGQLALLVGDAGLGKTRLLAEVRALAAGRVTWLEGQCLSYGTELLYGPFIEMLRKWIGAEEGEAELAVRTKLRATLGLLPASQLPDVLPYLARLLSIKLDPHDDERLRRLAPDELRSGIRRAYRTWLTALAARGPVVVAIEDIHWADPSTRELVEDMLELADVVPMLFICTSRIDPESEGWKIRVRILTDFAHRAVELPLGPLSDDAAKQLLDHLPKSRALDPVELELVVQGAEGNPLYLEELVSAFAEGKGPRRGQTWAGTMTSRVLTPTLESLLVARIDRLPPSARRLAQIAAVVGRRFSQRVLEHVAETESLEAELAMLLRADIIREFRRYPEPEYVFRHGLLRTASLTTLPPARRRQLYGAVGVAFETLFADSLDDHLEILAHYFARSDDLWKALDYLERAGQRAASLDAKTRAVQFGRQAARIAEELGDPAAQQRVRKQLTSFGVTLD